MREFLQRLRDEVHFFGRPLSKFTEHIGQRLIQFDFGLTMPTMP